MPERTEYAPGTPSWTDLATTAPEEAKTFYASVFGWDYDDQPIPEGGTYSLATKNGKAVASLAQQQADQQAAGVPPYWGTYVTVADVDATAGKAEKAGGRVMAGPFDVMDAGRMAVLVDPAGAVFCIWQPKDNIGAELVNEHGTLTWNELYTPDPAKVTSFYEELFGWKPAVQDMGGMDYTVFNLGDRGIGGAMKPPMEGMPSVWGVYFAVDDADAAAATVKSNGGTVMVEPMDIPEVGRFATMADPQGAVFNVLKPAQPQT